MTDKYDVGYGKPPRHSRFKSGTSGNPGGRPKGARNLKTELVEELSEKIRIKEGGQTRTVSKQRAMLKSLTAKAVHGDARAGNVILGLVFKLLHEDQTSGDEATLTKTDEAILAEFEAAILQARENRHE